MRFTFYSRNNGNKKLPDITVGAINHPQSNMADFYRELGDIFAVPLRPSNRWGGFKALRVSNWACGNLSRNMRRNALRLLRG